MRSLWPTHPWPKASHGWGTLGLSKKQIPFGKDKGKEIWLGLAVILLVGTAAGFAQERAPGEQPADQKRTAQVVFDFERPGLPVPRFTLTVHEDGTGRYEAEQVFPSSGSSDTPSTQPVDRAITLSAATTAQIFTTARALERFNMACASSLKGIADTGKKTLRYTGTGGDGSCTYNFSQDKRVVALTDMFQAIALTLDMGRKLDFDHRFDRLGLDATMASLAEQVDTGRAMELGTIASTLRSIARDSEVLERVRLRAARLLKQAQPDA